MMQNGGKQESGKQESGRQDSGMKNSDKKVLITNADDFGLDSHVNEAVEKAFLCGTLTSASVLVGMPATEEAARIARRHRGLGIGLHFNITLGRALGADDGSSLTQFGRVFRRRRSVEQRALLRRFRSEDIETELRAQLEALRALDVEIDHIDGHQHVHVLPGIFEVVARVASEQRLALRIPHHHFIRTGRLDRQSCRKLLRRALLACAMRLSGSSDQPPGLVTNDHFRCLFDLIPRPRVFGLPQAKRVLASLQPGVTEWMFHPSSRPAAGEAGTPLGALRMQELGLLSSWDLAEKLTCSTDIVLAHYGDLRRGIDLDRAGARAA